MLFIDQFITCRKDESLGPILNRQYHKHTRCCKRQNKQGKTICRFDFPRYPMRKTEILSPLDKNIDPDNVKAIKNNYKYIVSETEKNVKVNENPSFDEYLGLLNMTEKDYVLALRSNLRGHRVFLQKKLNERRLNGYWKKIYSTGPETWTFNLF